MKREADRDTQRERNREKLMTQRKSDKERERDREKLMTQRKSDKERERDREKENDIERGKERERDRMVGEIKMNFSTEQMGTGEIENLMD